MKMYFIADNLDTLTGMRLAGIQGTLVQTKDEALTRLGSIRRDSNIGILLVTEEIAREIREEIEALKEDSPFPIILEIPGPQGSKKDKNYILNYVKESIGIKI